MPLAQVIADGPLDAVILRLGAGKLEWLPWEVALKGRGEAVDGIYTYGHVPVDGAMLDRLNGVRVISNYGVGVDHIDLAAAAARGIPVGNTPGILNGATADMAFTLLLAAARRAAEGDRYARSPAFLRYDPGFMHGREVHSSTLGIIGLGGIGCEIAKRARGFAMRILYCNRRRRADEADFGATRVSFDDLLRRSDYVVLACPLTAETRNLIDAAALAKMKPSAFLVNIARGAIVDTQALCEALREKRIAGAGLDVTEPEPLPRGHPLLALDNVTITPHLGSATVETRTKMAQLSVENLLRGLRGEPLLHEVKPARR